MLNQETLNKNVEQFLHEVKNIKTKQDFLNRLTDYEKRIVQYHSIQSQRNQPVFFDNKPPTQYQQQIQNPFIQGEEVRKNQTVNQFKNYGQQDRNFFYGQQPISRTQSDFYRPPIQQDFQKMNFNGYDNRSKIQNASNLNISNNISNRNLSKPYFDSSINNMNQMMMQRQIQSNRPQQQMYPFQANEFLRNITEEQPDYVKFYKRQIPPIQQNSKINPYQKSNGTFERQNPFQKK